MAKGKREKALGMNWVLYIRMIVLICSATLWKKNYFFTVDKGIEGQRKSNVYLDSSPGQPNPRANHCITWGQETSACSFC